MLSVRAVYVLSSLHLGRRSRHCPQDEHDIWFSVCGPSRSKEHEQCEAGDNQGTESVEFG